MKSEEIVYFEHGSYFSGIQAYSVRTSGDGFVFEKLPSLSSGFKACRFTIPESAVMEISGVIKPAAKWKRHYKNPDEILDGDGWELFFNYGGVKVKSDGYMEYPEDYRSITDELEKVIDGILGKYGVNKED